MVFENIFKTLRDRPEKSHILDFYLQKYFTVVKKAQHSKTEEEIAALNERILKGLNQ